MSAPLLQGHTAVVTGARRGIGRAVLERFCQEGACVRVLNRREDPEFTTYCRSLEEKYSVRVDPVYADFPDEDELKAALKTLCAMKPAADILVNNAGVAGSASMLAMTRMEDIRRSFEVNFFAALTITQALSRQMMRLKKGSIVFISSSAAFDGGAGIDYCAEKAAIIGASRRLAVELSRFGIRVNALAPGLTNTDMGAVTRKEDEAVAVSRALLGRKAEPSEIADSVVYLASDLSRFVTGQVLRVDGGLLK